ncbi:unnamed protein product [Phaeothamnion confervicola]
MVNGDDQSVPDSLTQAETGLSDAAWECATMATADSWQRMASEYPAPEQSPSVVAVTVLKALRRNDFPYRNHGCEVAIRFSSSRNPASRLLPSEMRSYLHDPKMSFYSILSEWDAMDACGDLRLDLDTRRAALSSPVKRHSDPGWSAVNFDMAKEDGCWLIERLWADDKRGSSLGGGDGRGAIGRDYAGASSLGAAVAGRAAATGGPTMKPPAVGPVNAAASESLFQEDLLELMGCRFSDYDPAQLVTWLEQRPRPEFSARLVVLNSLLALRANDVPRRNAGTELVSRFCSPDNPASTLTPAHFARYLQEDYYEILTTWDEMSFHSEEVSDDGRTVDTVVLLRRRGEESFTGVNWELSRGEQGWLTDRIWVDDV